MKKPRKKYNPTARAFKYAKMFSKKFAVAWAGTLEPKIFDVSNMKPARLTQLEARSITDVAQKWHVHLCAVLRDHTGRDYIQTQELYFGNEYKSCDTSDVVEEHTAPFLKTCNSNHLVNYGWVATTSDKEITDEMIAKMMDNIGAWDFLAKHELEDHPEHEIRNLGTPESN